MAETRQRPRPPAGDRRMIQPQQLDCTPCPRTGVKALWRQFLLEKRYDADLCDLHERRTAKDLGTPTPEVQWHGGTRPLAQGPQASELL